MLWVRDVMHALGNQTKIRVLQKDEVAPSSKVEESRSATLLCSVTLTLARGRHGARGTRRSRTTVAQNPFAVERGLLRLSNMSGRSADLQFLLRRLLAKNLRRRYSNFEAFEIAFVDCLETR